MYIAQPPRDDLQRFSAAEPKMGNGTGTGNDHRQSPRDQHYICDGGNVEDYRMPVTSSTVHETTSRKVDNDIMTSFERFTSANQQQSCRHVTRTMSDGRSGRYGRAESSKSISQQWETPVKSRRQSDAAMKRKSRNEAELLVENEIIETMRREKELRYIK